MSIAARLVILLCTVLAALGGGWKAYHKGDATGYARARAEYADAALKASEAARAKEQELQAKVKGVNDAYIVEKRRRAADAATAQLELDGLREQLAAGGGAASTHPGTATGADATGGPERELLGACASRLVGLAGEADRLEGKVVGLQDYVRTVLKVCESPVAPQRPP